MYKFATIVTIALGSFGAGAMFGSNLLAPRAGATQNPSTAGGPALSKVLDGMSDDLQSMDKHEANVYASGIKFARLGNKLSLAVKQVTPLLTSVGSGRGSAAFNQATQKMQGAQGSFNLQYLGLQNTLQSENQEFTILSNVVKEKRKIVKKSIGNTR